MKLLVTDPIADAGIDLLRESGHEVETSYGLASEELLAAVEGVHALIVRSGTEVSGR